MNPKRHARDAAWRLTTAVVRVFAPLLRDEELIDAHREVFEVLNPGLVELLARYDRERARVGGGSPPGPAGIEVETGHGEASEGGQR